MLDGRRVVLAVTGGVAAYKAAYLARRLVEAGADVRAIMTDSAKAFLGPQTLSAITGHPVGDRLFGDPSSVSPHTELGHWAELVVIAPATTATIARIASGLSEDLVSATVLAARCPVLVAPAMHTEMWAHPATRRNLATLVGDGVTVVGPVSGSLAGGDEGIGRMVEPEDLLQAIDGILATPLRGWKVLVTAGGTREPIDPVRYVGNRSSGRMGHAVADEAARRGASVVLVTTSDLATAPAVERIRVETAAEMDAAVRSVAADVAVMAAAVADFRPADPADGKLNRADGPPSVVFEATPDVLAGVVAREDRPRVVVGFAAETGDLGRAVDKARRKGVDLLVANDVAEEGSGFGVGTNRVMIVRADGTTDQWPLMSKAEVAVRLWDEVGRLLVSAG
ncbi:MAG: bifunctional phosphopantothenoylcysteine decarboxylase/phosphopantothenate--cysteine ligase CoaBC [Acidimicrobiia bacterium]|jgi:phosphopantothenoylcysteine decarboxylase / phosphopantothenate---cysteine ligase